MQTSATRRIDQEIFDAVRSKGWADASVSSYRVPGQYEESGEWFLLNCRYKHDSPWQIIGRRRSRSELLTMLKPRTRESLGRWPER